MASPRPGAKLLVQSAEKLSRSLSPTPSPSPSDRCRKLSVLLQTTQNSCHQKVCRRFSDPTGLSSQQKANFCTTARKQFQTLNKNHLMNNNIVDIQVSAPIANAATHSATNTSTLKTAQSRCLSADASTLLLTDEKEEEDKHLCENTENFVRQTGDFTSKILETKEEVMQAQKLLYDVYIKDGGWMFDGENPTGFKIKKNKNGDCLLTDDLEDQATWFGALHDGRLISCARLIKRDRSGSLDINRYKDSEKPQLQNILDNTRLVEVQRCAISPEFRRIGTAALTLSLVAQYARYAGVDIIGTTSLESFKRLLIQCHGEVIDENFDYGDGVPTTVLYWPKSMLTKSLGKLESLIFEELSKFV